MPRIPFKRPDISGKFELGEQDAWKNRRRMAWMIVIWAVVILTFLAVFGKPDSLREALAYAISGILASTLGSYVFGAVWDDNNIRQTSVDAAAVDQGIPQTVVSGGGQVNIQQPQPAPGPEPEILK